MKNIIDRGKMFMMRIDDTGRPLIDMATMAYPLNVLFLPRAGPDGVPVREKRLLTRPRAPLQQCRDPVRAGPS